MKNLRWQVCNALQDKLAIGESRYLAKQDGTAGAKIFSWKTYNNYKQQAVNFANWAQNEHGCRGLVDAHDHIDEYIELHKSTGAEPWSAWTQKMARSAIAKVYGESSTVYAKCDERHKDDITRSRGVAARDSHFSAARNAEFVEFCRSTGLRRTEIEHLRGMEVDSRITERDGQYYLHLGKTESTKGGRARDTIIIGDHAQEIVDRIRNTAPGEKVWEHVPQCDIHDYRAQYAGRLYDSVARDMYAIPSSDRYYGRGANYGNVYDKQALAVVSSALGHGKSDAPRYDVVVGNYDRYFGKK